MKLANVSIDFESIYYYVDTMGLPHADQDKDYHRVVHRYLDLFAQTGVKATFFLVGNDIRSGKLDPPVLREMAAAGHELANHTMTHPHNLSYLSRERKEQEIVSNQRLIEDITGQRVVGFRAPCFDVDEVILDILLDQGYSYDSSVYPCYLKQVQELGYYLLCRGKYRSSGNWRYSFAPGDPYRPDSSLHRRGTKDILEIPIAMTPYLRLPFYSTVHFALGEGFLNFCYAALRSRRAFTYELHSIDLADYEGDRLGELYPGIERHPSMKHSLQAKTAMLRQAFMRFHRDYQLVTMKDMAERLKRR